MSELDIMFQEMYEATQSGNPRGFVSKQFSVAVEYGCTLNEVGAMYSEWLAIKKWQDDE